MGAYDELKKNLGTTQPVITPKNTTSPSTVVSPTTPPVSAFESLKKNLATPPVAPTAPAPAPVKSVLGSVADAYGAYADGARRVASDIFTGQASSVASLLSGLDWLGWKAAGKGADKVNEMAKLAAPVDPTFTDQLLQGAGSVSTFFIPATGVVKGARLIGKVSPALAMLFGNSSATALEALSEAGSVYDTNKKAGVPEAQASAAASKDFWANALLIYVTNKFGIFGEGKTLLGKALRSAPVEGFQEGAQQVISNLATGRPVLEGVAESSTIGAILGGGMGAGVDLVTSMPPIKPHLGAEAPEPTQKGNIKTETDSQDLTKPSIDLQKSLETQINNQNGESTTQEAPVAPSLPQQQNPLSQGAPVVETQQVNIPQTAPLVIPQSSTPEVNVKDANRNTNEKNTQEIVQATLEGLREEQRLSDQKNISIARDYPSNKIKKSAKPESIVKVYRAGTSISEGDHVTLDRANAERYAKQREGAKVVEIKVPLRDLVFSQGIKSEFIYAPKQNLDPKLVGKKMTVEKGAFDGIPVTDAEGNLIERSSAVSNIKKNLKYSIKADKEVGFVVRENKNGKNVVLGTFSTQEKAQEYINSLGKTQKEKVAEVVAEKPMTIKEVAEVTGILEPNVRRILGVGAKDGTFERVREGVYVLKTATGNFAYVEMGDAVTSLARMAESGEKFDAVILDPAYFSRALIGGNRGIKQWNFIMPDEFAKVMQSVSKVVKDDTTHVYLMLSGARTAQVDMEKYVAGATDAGFNVVGEGGYTKLTQEGKPITNVRGVQAAAERIILMTKSGESRRGEIPTELNFRFIRPRVAKAYQTEKAPELMKALIEQSTLKGETILDPFAGSGVSGAEALKSGRNAVMVEKLESTVENVTKPRIEATAKEIAEKTPKKEVATGNRIVPEDKDALIEKETKRILKEKYDNNESFFDNARADARELVKNGARIDGEFVPTPEVKVSKTDLKNAVNTMPNKEMVLTIEKKGGDTYLTAKNDKGSFRLKASALGLVEENLVEGDTITISSADLKAKGSRFRAVNDGGTFASVGEFRDGTPITLGEYENVKPIQFPELVSLSKELLNDYPKIVEKFRKEGTRGQFSGEGKGSIKLLDSLFEKKNLGQLQKTLAHEIGHLIDWLPDKTLSRGNVLGRLNSLHSFQKDFLPDQYRMNSELKSEMYELSKYWRPYDEETASASFKEYRKSSPEVYADFISALFNDPLLVQDMAPSAYNLFFQQLDAKPDVKIAYFELQDLLRNGAEVVARRKDKAKNMFNYGDAVAKERQIQLQAEEDAKQKSLWFNFKFQGVDITERVRELKEQMLKEGRTLNPDDDPTYYLDDRNYLGGEIRSMVDEKFNGIYQQLQKNDLSWEDLGEIMMYERILLGDRGEVANPEGLQPDFVQDLYGDIGQVKPDTEAQAIGAASMQAQLGDEKFNKLKELAKQFRANLKEVFEQGYAEGLYNEDLNKLIQSNDYYVPFKPIKYSGEKTRYTVKKQTGTLQPIENPANTAIEKAVAITRAIERNKVARKTIGFLQKEFSSEVEDAKLAFNGKVQIPQEPKKGSGQGLVTYHEGGKAKGFYVDEYISDAIHKNTISQNFMVLEGIQIMNSTLFRPLFITFNLGFQSFNVVRDFARFWKNIPDMTLLRTLNLYRKSFRAAKIRGFGLPKNPSEADIEANNLINEMYKERILSVTFNDLIKGEEIEDRQIDRILRETGVRKAEPTKLGLIGEKIGVDRNSIGIRQAISIMDWIESTGNLIETLPKVAGRFALEGKMPPREMRRYVRKYLGSPDFLAGGKFKPVVNEIFLFANAIFQGIRADYEIATQPKTRSGYWWKTTQANIVPKLLMLAASAGLLGDWLKEVFGKMSEYDKTNYITVPLGIDENGKAIYFRVPQDETGRLLSGLFWKAGRAAQDPKKLLDTDTYTNFLSYAGGQTPSVTPAIHAVYDVGQFIAGENPYDFFRQRPVLTDDQMAAGGMEKVKPFAMYMFNQLGGGVFMKVYVNETVPKEKTLGERVISLPVASNIAGRFIKITNYGETEQLKEVQKEIRSDKAREGLQNRRTVFEYVQKSQGVSYGEKQKIKQDMIREIYDGLPKTKEDRLQARSLERRFELLRLRGSADAQLDALLIAQSNDEKVALLQAYKTTMSPKEFEELRKFIIRNKVVSSDAYAQFIRASNSTRQ